MLWLDACSHSYVEEVGTMNIFFKIDGVLVTPSLEGGSILGGITRDSVITLAESMGYKVEGETDPPYRKYMKLYRQGKLEDVFGTGTAAVISPVGELNWNDNIIKINDGEMGEFSKMMYDKLTGIQYGKEEDSFGWIEKIC